MVTPDPVRASPICGKGVHWTRPCFRQFFGDHSSCDSETLLGNLSFCVPFYLVGQKGGKFLQRRQYLPRRIPFRDKSILSKRILNEVITPLSVFGEES